MNLSLALLFLALPLAPIPALQESAASLSVDEALRSLQERYGKIRSLSADFVQVFQSMGTTEKESGVLVLKRPGQMYWEYREPKQKFFVSDGEKTVFFVPEDHQAIEGELEKEGQGSPLEFLFGDADLLQQFVASWETEEEPSNPGSLLVRLVPKQPTGEFSRLLLELDREQYLIRRLAVVEPIGHRNDYFFSNIRQNISVDDRNFRLRLPRGTQIIRQD